MKINKTQLLAALETVKPGLANRELIEQSTSFAFMDDRIVTYNDEISISHPIEGLEIVGAINANELYNLLGKLKKEEIDLTVTDSELLIKCGSAKAGLTLQSEITLPIGEIGKKGKWKAIPEDLLKAMSFVMGCAVKDMSQPILMCVHVNKAGYVEASDSYRISKMILNEELPVKTFLIPASSVAKVVKMNPVKIAEGDGWIHFKTENGSTISCRVFSNDSFPDTSPFLKVKGTAFVFPDLTKDILEKAAIFCKKDGLHENINITLDAGKFSIKSQSESGWFEETVKIKYTGDTIVFSLPPATLKYILTETLECSVSNEKMIFAGENWVYVTSLNTI
jgi:hypothetical protein